MGIENIYKFHDREPLPDNFFEYTNSIRDNSVPLIIDNGGHQCRVGWAIDEKPRLAFRNLVAKSRGKKDGDPGGISVGNDIGNLEMVRWALRTQFDRDIVTHYECQEQVFDHIFSHLSINTPGCVSHPIVLTEPVCNPNYCRQLMSELLFECYRVPQVAYGIDSLFSLYNSSRNPEKCNALVVSSSCQVSHVLPVINGRLDARNCKRINLGGFQASWYMQRLLQLKYPAHAPQLTLSRAQELVQDHTYIALDYGDELDNWTSTDFYEKEVRKIQLPFVQVAPKNQNGNTKNDEKEKARRLKQGKRLQEINARRREEKLAEEEERLSDLLIIQELELKDEDKAFERALQENGFQSSEALHSSVKSLKTSIRKRREKLVAMQTAAELDSAEKEELEAAEPQAVSPRKRHRPSKDIAIEDKPQQQTAGNRRTKEERKQEHRKSVEEQQRDETFKKWLSGLHKRREEIAERRAQRQQRRQELNNRRSQASMQRMRILSQLAYDPNVRDDGTTRSTHKKPKEDTFGQNDEDWMVYRAINKDAGESDSEKEQEEMNELENLLKKHDPSFANERSEDSKGTMDLAEYYQLHLGVERVRVPEIVFQPSMLGIEQAGISETIAFILNHYPRELQTTLVQNVFITGGNTKFANFKERLERELLAIRPFQSSFYVHSAADPVLGAWCGARKWLKSVPDLSSVSISRQEYDEKGGDYLKEHFASNLYIATP